MLHNRRSEESSHLYPRLPKEEAIERIYKCSEEKGEQEKIMVERERGKKKAFGKE